MSNLWIIILAVALIAIRIMRRFSAGTVSAADESAVREALSRGATLVDVRTPEEFAQGHWDGAINIPLDDVPARLDEFGECDAPVVLYCRTGRRSRLAAATLGQHGFNNVINAGGLEREIR